MKKQTIRIKTGTTTGVSVVVPVVQGDSGRILSCIVADMELKDTYSARIYAVKPSKEEVYNDCVINGNAVETELTSQLLAETGGVGCQIRITNEEAKVVSSFPFTLDVKKSLMSGSAIESSNEFKALDQALNNTKESVYEATADYLEAHSVAGTAQAGQFIVVKTVDENGKITEIEASDPPGSGSVRQERIPEYWQVHLDEKIGRIKALQDAGGKDVFSYIVITDIHYGMNLGKISPLLAKKIMDECGIRYVLILGDLQNRSAQGFTKEQVIEEWKGIDSMLLPIANKALVTQGNHDGSYGTGNAFNLTPGEIYNLIYRKAGMEKGLHFDDSGTGYYVEDTVNKVLYIVLNSHCNKYELNGDGTAKYGNLDTFRFTQSQYDLVIEALTNIPDGDWSVILSSHVPLDRSGEYVAWGGDVDENEAQTGEPADCVIMMRMLNAFVNRTAYTGSFTGTQADSVGYVNLADTSGSDWTSDSRINSSGTVEGNATGRNVTNYIPYVEGEILKIKGLTIYTADRFAIYDSGKNRIYLGAGSGLSSCITTEDGVIYIDTNKFKDIHSNAAGGSFIRLPVQLVDGEMPIITTGDLNTSNEVFDAVFVNVDFSDAKGTLVSYHGGHVHKDIIWSKDYAWNGAEQSGFCIISTRCDAREENEEDLINERVPATATEQSFDVFTVNKSEKKIYATKIGAGSDREIDY